jgi:hypothetical protein
MTLKNCSISYNEKIAVKTEAAGENLPQYHFVHHKVHMM